MAPKRRRGSDADYVPSGKRRRFEPPSTELESEDELTSFDINSSAPGSPSKSMAIDLEEEDDLDSGITELPFPLLPPLITQSAYPSTPNKAGTAGPSSTSPLTPMIPPLPSSSGPGPTPPRRGRPHIRKVRKHTRIQLNGAAGNQESQATFEGRAQERMRVIQAQRKKEAEADLKRKAEEAALREARREEVERKKQLLAQVLYAELAQKVTGGVNVERAWTGDGVTIESMGEFFKCLLARGGDQQVSAKITRLCQSHGSDIMHGIYKRAKEAGDTFIDEMTAKKSRREGAALR